MGERTLGLVVPRLVHRQRDEDANRQVRLDLEPGGDLVEDPLEDELRLVALLELVEGERRPVRGEGGIGPPIEGDERRLGLGGRAEGIVRPVESAERLREPTEELRPERRARIHLEQLGVPISCGLPLSGGESQVGLESGPGRSVILEEASGRDVESLGQVVERCHRRLDEPVLKGADVRLRVAAVGESRLREPGLEPLRADAGADATGQGPVQVGPRGRARRLRCLHYF